MSATGGGDVQARADALLSGLRRPLLLFAVIGLVAFGGGIAGFAIGAQKLSFLQEHGIPEQATVLDVVHYHPTSGGRRIGVFDDHIDVGFADAGGHEQHARIGIGNSDTYHPGQVLGIDYDPADPASAILQNGYSDTVGSGGIFYFFGLLLGPIVLVFSLRRLHRLRRLRRLLRASGREMTAARETVTGRGRRAQRLVFTHADGTRIETRPLRLGAAEAFRNGTAFTVFRSDRPRTLTLAVRADGQQVLAGRHVRGGSSSA